MPLYLPNDHDLPVNDIKLPNTNKWTVFEINVKCNIHKNNTFSQNNFDEIQSFAIPPFCTGSLLLNTEFH